MGYITLRINNIDGQSTLTINVLLFGQLIERLKHNCLSQFQQKSYEQNFAVLEIGYNSLD